MFPSQTPQPTTAAVATDNCYADDGAFGTSHTATHSNPETNIYRVIHTEQ